LDDALRFGRGVEDAAGRRGGEQKRKSRRFIAVTPD
jgi:hypothetical protein